MVSKIFSRCLQILGFLLLCTSASYPMLINYKNDPDLAEALKYDIEMNGGKWEIADRAKAEEYYLKYAKKTGVPSFQKAEIYSQLGALYAAAINIAKKEKIDYEKAHYYFEKVLESEPERVGNSTVRARSMLTALGDNEMGMPRIKAKMEFYLWIDSLDAETLKHKWLPSLPFEPVEDLSELEIQKQKDKYEERLLDGFNRRKDNFMKYLKTAQGISFRAAVLSVNYMQNPYEGFDYIWERLPEDAIEDREYLAKAIKEKGNIVGIVSDHQLKELNNKEVPPRELVEVADVSLEVDQDIKQVQTNILAEDSADEVILEKKIIEEGGRGKKNQSIYIYGGVFSIIGLLSIWGINKWV